jgi:hypothetical protein
MPASSIGRAGLLPFRGGTGRARKPRASRRDRMRHMLAEATFQLTATVAEVADWIRLGH